MNEDTFDQYHLNFQQQRKDIRSKRFWRDRLEWAKGIGEIHRSVYYIAVEEWDRIEEEHVRIILSTIPEGSKVLDCGCGYGRISRFLNPSHRYVGVDFSSSLILEARRLFPKTHFVLGNLKKLNFEDKNFDWAICVSIRDMVVDNLGQSEWNLMLKEILRVSKKLLILEYDGRHEILTSSNA